MKKLTKLEYLVVQAYNAGMGRVASYGGAVPFQETQNYVKRICERYDSYKEKETEYEVVIAEHSNHFCVDPVLVKTIIDVESSWRSDAISNSGARGLMQITKPAWTDGTNALVVKWDYLSNVFDPKKNIAVGCAYLWFLFGYFKNRIDNFDNIESEYVLKDGDIMSDEKVVSRIIMSKGISLISRIIRFVQGRYVFAPDGSSVEYTHAAHLLSDPAEKELIVIEAWHRPLLKGGGVRKIDFNEGHSDGTEYDVFEVEMTLKQKMELDAFMEEQLGKKYDFRGVFSFVTKSSKQNEDKLFCTELLFEGYKKIGIDLLTNISASNISPAFLSLSPKLKLAGSGKTKKREEK